MTSSKFIDSYKFLATRLGDFHKRFKLREAKQIFPYSFMSLDTLSHRGKIPDFDYFVGFSDTSNDLKVKQQYYQENKNSLYDFRQIILSYILSDCRLLTLGVCLFYVQCFDLQRPLLQIFQPASQEKTLNLILPFSDFCTLSAFG